jgi:hypothetical protein
MPSVLNPIERLGERDRPRNLALMLVAVVGDLVGVLEDKLFKAASLSCSIFDGPADPGPVPKPDPVADTGVCNRDGDAGLWEDSVLLANSASNRFPFSSIPAERGLPRAGISLARLGLSDSPAGILLCCRMVAMGNGFLN